MSFRYWRYVGSGASASRMPWLPFQGRGGFQLSLFGSEWEADFVQLTQKKGGEDEIRVDVKTPEKSLILLKPTVQIKHKDEGTASKKDSWQYNMILKWVRGGIKNDFDKTGELQRLEVTPAEIVFAQSGAGRPASHAGPLE